MYNDDLKHLDWKVYSRTGRFFLKQYEEETNLTLWLLVDSSESMRYGSGPKGDDGQPLVRKYDYACMSAAALFKGLFAEAGGRALQAEGGTLAPRTSHPPTTQHIVGTTTRPWWAEPVGRASPAREAPTLHCMSPP